MQKYLICFCLISVVLATVILSLIETKYLNGFYFSMLSLAGFDRNSIKHIDFGQISNAGHFVISFLSSLFAMMLFKKRIVFISMAGFFFLCEFLQGFTATRQPGLGDILLSMSGVVLGGILMVFKNRILFLFSKVK